MQQGNSRISGTIIKGIGGFYYVKTKDKTYECKARGIFRRDKLIPLVGDEVEIDLGTLQENIIYEIHPRENEFIRPPVANVELAVIVSALSNPEPNFSIVDKLITMAEKSNVEVILVFNKEDAAEPSMIKSINEIYINSGYPLIFASAKTGVGIEQLRGYLKGKKSMLAGPSGVGKSSLLNALEPGFTLQTGDISQKTLRGKHTTRHVELMTTADGLMVFDTPGFTSFSLIEVTEDELRTFYQEFEPYETECRFKGCNHVAEPGCEVKKAVEEGKINKLRYQTYVQQYTEIVEKRRKR